MYHQILVDSQDVDLQRIVWQQRDEVEKHFQLLTVTYGINCAPFLALRVLKQLARDEAWRFPRAARILEDSSYVDDILYGADDVSSAQQLRDELIGLTAAGGFPLHKWTSSHPDVLDDLPEDVRLRPEWRDFSADQPVKTLGIAWDPSNDEIRYRTLQSIDPDTPTKRAALSVIARLFDPVGWLSPVIITAKIIMQDMWRDRLDWDDKLPQVLARRWQDFIKDLPSVTRIRIPRWLGATSSDTLELHGFADASKAAYGGAVYVATTDSSSNRHIRLLASKSRVAPLKTQTIPRLELCAAALLAALLHKLKAGLGEQVTAVHAWTDSTVTLAWIKGEPSNWEVFVANRVSRIHQLVPGITWRHLPSEDNPADLVSRGITVENLIESTLWWEGPTWLSQPPSAWPEQPTSSTHEDCAFHGTRRICAVNPLTWVVDLTRFSRLETLLRVIARCLRFPLLILPRGRDFITQPFRVTELNRAYYLCVRHVQSFSFREEIAVIRRGHALGRKNRLAGLSPFLDSEGTLRVGGRLEYARLPYEQRHPVLLPRNSHLGHLIIDRAHKTAMHGGQMLTYAHVMRSAWIIGGRAQTRAFVRKCIICARNRARPASQLMGNLPAVRVEPAEPFSRTGLDYAGPFILKVATGRNPRTTKGYLVVFVCMCTKAVHLEVVGDLTTASFMGALHRFAARRSAPREIWSDNATTLHGADAELRAMFREARLDWDEVSNGLASSGISWNFIPPSAPHFGGLWEAAVKSAKSHLKRVVGQRPLTFEEMTTVCAEIESCLNSRPLAPLSGDIDDLQALTPWHLVTGFAPTSLPRREIEPTENLDHMTHWRMVKGMRDQFWARWSREYLHTLQRRSKWRQPQPNLEVGCLVLVLDTALLRHGRWPLGRITAIHPGSDHRVRVVTVKTANGDYDRPITKICKLPLNDQGSI